MAKKVIIAKGVIDGLVTYSRSQYPREGILLLRGKRKKDAIEVDSLVIPPFAVHGEGFSSFPMSMLPIDSSILGVAHSHPSRSYNPSLEDLSHPFGSLSIIARYPYQSERDIAVYDKDGNPVEYTVI